MPWAGPSVSPSASKRSTFSASRTAASLPLASSRTASSGLPKPAFPTSRPRRACPRSSRPSASSAASSRPPMTPGPWRRRSTWPSPARAPSPARTKPRYARRSSPPRRRRSRPTMSATTTSSTSSISPSLETSKRAPPRFTPSGAASKNGTLIPTSGCSCRSMPKRPPKRKETRTSSRGRGLRPGTPGRSSTTTMMTTTCARSRGSHPSPRRLLLRGAPALCRALPLWRRWSPRMARALC
jgi:hypothetical protein